jgi:hypothetical protein
MLSREKMTRNGQVEGERGQKEGRRSEWDEKWGQKEGENGGRRTRNEILGFELSTHERLVLQIPT